MICKNTVRKVSVHFEGLPLGTFSLQYHLTPLMRCTVVNIIIVFVAKIANEFYFCLPGNAESVYRCDWVSNG